MICHQYILKIVCNFTCFFNISNSNRKYSICWSILTFNIDLKQPLIKLVILYWKSRTMAKRCLRRHLWGGPSKMVPSATAGPVPLTIPQWYTHWPGVKCVCMPTYFRARPPIVPLQVAAHQKIVAAGYLRGPLLHQGSQPTWFKALRRPKKPPWLSFGSSPQSSFNQTHRRFFPESSQEDLSGLPYRRAPTPPMRPQRSLRPPPPTPLHRQPAGAVK